MSEIKPQLTYDPAIGVLELQPDTSPEVSISTRRQQRYEHLLDFPGVETDDAGVIQVEVRKALGGNFGYERGGAVDDFLLTAGAVLPFKPEDADDHMLIPHWLSPTGFKGAVYPQLQKWINTQNLLDEQVARDTLGAMAMPFGEEYERKTKRNFRMLSEHWASTNLFELQVIFRGI